MQPQGLTDEQAERLWAEGKGNTFESRHSKSTRKIIYENIFSGNNLIMLIVIGGLYAAFLSFADPRLLMDSAGIVMVFIVNSIVAIIQELRARTLLEKARLMLPQSVSVIRDGKKKEISQERVVKGDVLSVHRGDYVPVDGTILVSNSLEADESLLTGESLPIIKTEGDTVFSGSFCVSGSALFVAEKVGKNSLAASITDLARKYKFVTTPLQRNLNRIFIASFIIALIAVGVEIMFRHEELFTDVDFIRRIAAVILSLLPGGLIFFSTVTFAVGVWRVSRLGAVVQKLNAIESFSTVTTVCMDKTGTLTQNAITIHSISPTGDYSKEEAELLAGTFARLCNNPNATINALMGLTPDLDASLLYEMPFSSARKYSALQIRSRGKDRLLILGAPEILCADSEEILEILSEESKRGYRNVLIAETAQKIAPEYLSDALESKNIRPIAIISLQDPLREDAAEALELFKKQDIRLKILSGDHPESVYATVKASGWNIDRDDIIFGKKLDKLNEIEFEQTAHKYDIFARLSPEHKLRIIKALNKKNTRTAMIGDGVNDVPAIKEAALGIAMEEGSSMTKEISDIILLKNKFSLLPSIFAEGNNIISTVLLISELYLVKNIIVLLLSLLRTIGVTGFYDISLTPRKTALLTTAGVALPAYCIALWNSRTEPQRRFFKELFGALIFTLIGVSAALIFAEQITVRFYSDTLCPPCCHLHFDQGSNVVEEVVPFSVIVYSLIVNFVMITLPKNSIKAKEIIGAGIIITLLFSVFLWIPSDNWLTYFIHLFYEFTALPIVIMPVIFGSVAAGTIISWFLRRILRR